MITVNLESTFDQCYYGWLSGIDNNGTITVNKDAEWNNDINKGEIPSSWTITKV